jgi:hypothetical protein
MESEEKAKDGARGVSHRVYNFADFVLKARFAQSFGDGAARYPLHRELRFAARLDLQALFDDLALTLGLRAQHLGGTQLILDGDDIFVAVYGSRKTDYCSCAFYMWSDSLARIEGVRDSILAKVGAARITQPMFSIAWNFVTGNGQIESASIEEMADDVLHDEAYPELAGGVAAFIGRYIASPDTILVLQGPPGTGKSRLIRAILGELARRNDGARAMYTGDKRAFESDAIFVEFITGDEEVLVIEDADHLLRPRAAGNENLHRFLAIADGVVRAQGRKIVFSTNLPNIGDLDDALVRPGRCFARVLVRELTLAEAEKLAWVLCDGDDARVARAIEVLDAAGRKTHSLAEIYRACERESRALSRAVE